MRLDHHVVGGSSLLDPTRLQGDSVHLLRGRGRGGYAQVPPGWVVVVLAFATNLELTSGEGSWTLPAQHVQIWLEGSLTIQNRSQGTWLALACPQRLWTAGATRMPELFPSAHPRNRAVTRAMVQLARRRWYPQPDCAQVMVLLRRLADCLAEGQQDLQHALVRCSGRTSGRRQQTLLRLLRVQHLIRCHIDNRLDLHRLAASANYSPSHLIRVYREVFGETPGEFANRLRRERAWQLVCGTEMAVCEISEALGFVSESAFCRAFKDSFGQTTSEARQRPRRSTRLGSRTASVA